MLSVIGARGGGRVASALPGGLGAGGDSMGFGGRGAPEVQIDKNEE
jgi:hypothetical protein